MKPGYLLFRTPNYCLKKPHKTYIVDVRCDAGRVFDYTSYFVTVGLSNTVQLRLWGSESAPSPTHSQASMSSRNGDSGAVPIQRGNGESQVKQIKDVPIYRTWGRLESV